MSHVTAPANRHLVLALLIIVYTLNFLDRQILSILAVPIKEEFGLSDAQLGWLGGLAFGLIYSLLAIPAAWLADRYSRTWIMTGALTLWSGFTALCGLAGSYVSLFIARMGVGVGEAGGVAPAYSLITDYFPPEKRARALAIFSFGIPIGSASGVLYGGLMASAIDWRFAFISIGLFGVIIAPVFKLIVKEPPRPRQSEQVPPLSQTLGRTLAKPVFWCLALGAGTASLVGYGLMFWLPSFLSRTYALSLSEVSVLLAAILFCGGMCGLFAGGWLADRLGQRSRRWYPLVPAIGFALSACIYSVGVFAPAPLWAFFLFAIPQALGLMWFGPVLTAVQHLGPAQTRSQVSALFLLVTNLIGLGLGPAFFGQVSDWLVPQYGDESMKYAFLIGLGFYLIASGLMLLASRRVEREWVE